MADYGEQRAWSCDGPPDPYVSRRLLLNGAVPEGRIAVPGGRIAVPGGRICLLEAELCTIQIQ